MWRRLLASVLFLALLSTTANAQDATQALLEKISHDVESLSVNTPIWIAQHAPASMRTI